MSIAIVFNNKDPEPWKIELEKNLPDTLIEIYPAIKDITKVQFILCWKPAPGLIAEFPAVKAIQSVGASVDHILNTQQLKEDIILSRIVDHNLSIDMFEFLLATILYKLKNIDQYAEDKRNKVWKPVAYGAAADTMLTVLGLGQIGSFVGERLAQMGFKVKGWSATAKSIAGITSFHGPEGYPVAVKNADFLINLLPLTAETRDIIGYSVLSQLKKGAIFINAGRGEHVIEKDLIGLLDSGHLAAAYLDVFRMEPLPYDHPFWQHRKIFISPHIASLTNIYTAALLVAGNYRRLLNKQELLYTVSHHRGY
jgi:glyoxylate/hydroxypyruvate reductase A